MTRTHSFNEVMCQQCTILQFEMLHNAFCFTTIKQKIVGSMYCTVLSSRWTESMAFSVCKCQMVSTQAFKTEKFITNKSNST